MKNSDKICPVCGLIAFVESLDYLMCGNCGHEILNNPRQEAFIVNDPLSMEYIEKTDLLDKFKEKTLKKCSIEMDYLLDVGSASGKFLYRNKSIFKSCAGIEVTRDCIAFARNRLGLTIETDISKIDRKISVSTFWHSLEHIPAEEIDKTLKSVYSNSSPLSRVIVSVPNNGSLQYLLFRQGYAYYDSSSHIHQFSPQSLDMLMRKHGFEKICSISSLSYSLFGYLQGFINKLNTIHNYLYYRKKRNWTFNRNKAKLLFLDSYNYFLVALFILPSLLLCIYDMVNPDKGGVLTTCYKKKID